MYYCVHGEKLNLLSWAIRPVFIEPVTYTQSSSTTTLLALHPGAQQLYVSIVTIYPNSASVFKNLLMGSEVEYQF